MSADTRPSKVSNVIGWVMCAVYLVSVIAFAWWPGMGTGIIAACGTVFIFLHGSRRYGAKGCIAFVIIAYVISTIMEDLSIRTGFPFGNYYYNDDYVIKESATTIMTQGDIPHIDMVPMQVGLMYIAMCYLSWSLASVILDHADRHLDRRSNRVALPAIAAFIMCQFDLVQDPVTSTYDGIWIWERGGGVFGVPCVNFLGWYLTAFLIMFVFAEWLAHHPQLQRTTPELKTRGYWLQPVLMYLTIGFSYVCQFVYQYLYNADGVVTDLSGTTWSTLDIHEAALTIMVFTMLYSGVLALIKVLQSGGVHDEKTLEAEN